MRERDLLFAIRETTSFLGAWPCEQEATLEDISTLERALRTILDRAKLDAMHHEKSTPTYGDHEEDYR